MLSQEIKKTLSRLLMLSVLTTVFGLLVGTDTIETVSASTDICFQDCEKYEQMCLDICKNACATNSRDKDCNECIAGCFSQSNYCAEHSIWCSSGSVTYSPQCTVQFGLHCPIIGGVPDCTPQGGAHNNYFETCNQIGYENGCIVCPDGEHCQNDNTGNLPHCL